MRYYLGIDVGGTKSHALVVDENGYAVGFGQGGAGNPTGKGYAGLSQVLQTIVTDALRQAEIAPAQIAGIGMGVGGYDWPSQREVTLATLTPIGMNAPAEVVNDAALGIWAGTDEGWGVSVVSGTGCNCRGRNREGREGRMTGYGIYMAEAAGAVEILFMAFRAIGLDVTRRGPATALTQAFVEYAGARDPEHMLELLTTQLGRFSAGGGSPLVFSVAAQGDPVAQEIIVWAGRELGSMVCGVVRQIDMAAEEFQVVMVGSTFNGSPVLAQMMQETVLAVAPRARFVRLTVPPVVGAALLGMEQGGLTPFALRPNVIASTRMLMESLAR
ncbi:MAG: BadF/BadG/BcrA/BcrD ATPase family protein [Anaerolineae bacterium]